ncbi:hypothetical protein [Fimbriiglobus ruber]|uniref:Uncharacterized protein n=1 Tax=Fimbriiglobus ruber TaxID=1908690 RepID=A0A225DU70_9BACT|nr:hypothetical protein [Fimbriiglobus ruber]OWK43164.1 hypothetical protein FRUB_02763 [Fimbriiglobus ruber]
MGARTFFSIAFAGLFILGSSPVAPEASPSLAEMLAEYQNFGLPLPPKAARFVKYEYNGEYIRNGEIQPPQYSLAFEIKPGTKTDKPILLRGTEEVRPYFDLHAVEVPPEPAATDGIEWDSDVALVLAIQCHSRGWDKLAGRLLDVSRKNDAPAISKHLVITAWAYWEGQVTHPTTDRRPVLKRLKDLIHRDADLDTKYHRRLIRSLELALVPSHAKPGSIDALIDRLVDYQTETGKGGEREPGEPFWQVARLGFDAVPALIEHLDDDRLTRVKMAEFHNFPPWHLRVGDVAGDLLEGLADAELDRGTPGENVGGGWLRRQQGYPVLKSAALDWWEKNRKTGEETYLLNHVFPTKAKEGKQPEVNQHILNVITAKYPDRIPGLYKKVLDERAELGIWELVDALERSKLSDKEKIALLVSGVKRGQAEHRLPALGTLRKFDQQQFNNLLLNLVENLPKDVPAAYWSCPEARLVRFAMECDDPRIWPLLEKVAKRSSIGLRMEVLSKLNYIGDTKYRIERLRLYSSFLDDSALCDRKTDDRFSGPGASFNYDKIEVRDFIALELARLLGIDIKLKRNRTPAEWAKIRESVRVDLKRELDGTK